MPCVLKVTEAFTIGMHATALLARHSEQRLQVKTIARQCAISEAHLAKVLQRLARCSIVKGERGPTGGFKLNRPAEKISLMDIWDAIEGNTQSNICPFAIPACKSEKCSIGKEFIEKNRQIEELMKRTTLQKLGAEIGTADPKEK